MPKTTLNENEKSSVLNEVLFMAATGNLDYQSEDELKREKREQGFAIIRSADGIVFSREESITPAIAGT